MGFTNFPGGLTSMGIPLLGGGTVPFGPTSKVFFVSGAEGSDGHDGTTPKKAVASVSKAHSLCTSGKNDVVFVMGNGQTSGTARETATITWSKHSTHLVGVAAPGLVGQRARISMASGTSDVTPQLLVSGQGCMFSNLHLFQNFSTGAANVCVSITGYRNVFLNCHIAGGGSETGASHAGMRSLVVESAGTEGENYFKGCTIGLDTIHRGGAASAEIEFKNATNRNVFEDCLILARTTGSAHRLVHIGASGISRWVIFKNCVFLEETSDPGGTAMTEMMNVPTSAGGFVLCQNCVVVGTNFEAVNHGKLIVSQENDMKADSAAI